MHEDTHRGSWKHPKPLFQGSTNEFNPYLNEFNPYLGKQISNAPTMEYAELLLTEHWQHKRREIIGRDGFTCMQCQNHNLTKDLQRAENVKFTFLPDKNFYFVELVGKEKEYNKAFVSRDLITYKGPQVAFFSSGQNGNSKIICSRKWSLAEKVDLAHTLADMASGFFDADISKIREKYYRELGIPANVRDILPNEKMEWIFALGLHVHHTYYQINKLPWQYDNDALVTLCWECHETLHRHKQIPVLDDHGNVIAHYTPCFRCCGAGHFPEYIHIESGICFRCDGARYEELMR